MDLESSSKKRRRRYFVEVEVVVDSEETIRSTLCSTSPPHLSLSLSLHPRRDFLGGRSHTKPILRKNVCVTLNLATFLDFTKMMMSGT